MNFVLTALSQFGVKLLTALVSENMLKKIFFFTARRLAEMTDTPIDDHFVDELEKSFNASGDTAEVVINTPES